MTDQPTRLYIDNISVREKAFRALWQITRFIFFSSLPGPLFRRWRILLLRCFGAQIGIGCRVDASCKIWWPGNLRMGNYACLAYSVDCYNVASITIGDYATISQRTFLCSAGHSTKTLARALTSAPIIVGAHAWVAAEAYVGAGVRIGDGAVLGARSVATRDLEPWTIYAGIPARAIKRREIC